TRQLNEALVEESIGPLPLAEPKLLQHFVRLVEEPPIKALEVPQIMGVKVASSKLRNQSRNLGALGAHAQIINAPTRREKREEGRKQRRRARSDTPYLSPFPSPLSGPGRASGTGSTGADSSLSVSAAQRFFP